jgi:hypothetical protein
MFSIKTYEEQIHGNIMFSLFYSSKQADAVKMPISGNPGGTR